MTLNRSDILTRCRVRSKADTRFANGYVVHSMNNRGVLSVVLFYGDVRLKGYCDVKELVALLEGRTPKAAIKQVFPRS